ncbi:MAG: hypothetical protein U9P82_04015 [Bacteroidota bacterium]|nr:hypothetical protein [Bacteroidota bacterium]
MKKIFLLSICLIIVKVSFSFEPTFTNEKNTVKSSVEENKQLLYTPNYQQFKTQLLNIETKEVKDYARLRRRGKDDYLMLYVAGGIAIATTTLILTNNPDNFVSNSPGSVNTGIAIGGGIACGLIVTKFIIDQNR